VTPAVELLGITKRFGSFTANDAIDLRVARGEVHAVIGENGAGKTTLMNVLFGLLQPDAGEIRIDGRRQVLASPATAIAAGLGMVHQHFKLVPSLTVAENVFLGMELRRAGLIDQRAQIARTLELSQRFRLHLDPTATVGLLSVGIEQRIEILKVLVRGARTIILDEPTAVLTPQESRELFRTLRGFTAQAMTVIFITHHLDEVMAVADSVTVLRDGRRVATVPRSEVSRRELVRMMVGREVSFTRRERPPCAGEVVLTAERLWARDDRGLAALRDVSFEVRRGEVVGIAGVAGNGQTELAEVLAGLRPASHGSVRLLGRELACAAPSRVRAAGLAHVPADRLVRGLDRNASVAENVLLGRHAKAPWSRRGVLRWRAIRRETARLIERFDIRTRGPDEPVKRLSGGNMQKVVLAREFTAGATFLIVDQPTRGVDIGAQETIHDEIMRQRGHGRAILLISVQLDELLALADRILVMFGGRIVGEVAGERADQETLGLMMAGIAQAGPGLSPVA
jgi:simple sugar transport system ATP-binding protein